MQQTTNYPATMRDLLQMAEKLDVTVPRLLEVPGPTPTPPAGYTPDYFVNEFTKEPVPEFVGFSAPDIERPGYRLQRSWTPEEGVCVFIDHLSDEPFTIPEIADLIATLTRALDFVAEESPSPTAPEGYSLAHGCSDHFVGAETMNRDWIITPAWNATTGAHSLELWAANHEAPNYATLAPAKALQLAADLIAVATATLTGGKK